MLRNGESSIADLSEDQPRPPERFFVSESSLPSQSFLELPLRGLSEVRPVARPKAVSSRSSLFQLWVDLLLFECRESGLSESPEAPSVESSANQSLFFSFLAGLISDIIGAGGSIWSSGEPNFISSEAFFGAVFFSPTICFSGSENSIFRPAATCCGIAILCAASLLCIANNPDATSRASALNLKCQMDEIIEAYITESQPKVKLRRSLLVC